MTQDARKTPDPFAALNRQHEIAEELLRFVNASRSTRELIHSAVTFFREQLGCEAIGIRLRNGEDYPYYEARGFPPEFVKLENHLCQRDLNGQIVRDDVGNPVIECMCGNVICGRFDPAKPFFTPRGSFWTNCTTELLASTTEADRQARTRNRCNGEGYESVALIPLHVGEEGLGLLQLNDRRRGMFTPESIALWERLAGYLAVGIAKLRSDEALRESQQRMQAVVEGTSDAVYLKDLQGRYLLFNRAAAGFVGKPPKDVLGHDDTFLFPPDEARTVMDGDRAVMAEGKTATYEEHVTTADGVQRTFLSTKGPVLGADGNVTGLFGVARDITDRRRVEETLRESEERFRTLVEQAGDGMELVDREGRYLDVNAATLAQLGYTREEMLRLAVFDVDPTVDRQRFARDSQLLAGGTPLRLESVHRRKDGSEFPVEIVVSAVRLHGQKCFLTLVRDDTARRQMEESLRRERDRAQRYLDTVEAVVLALDCEGRITLLNGKGCRLLGYGEGELIGQPWFSTCLPQPDGTEQVYPYFLRLIAGEVEAVEHFENPIRTRDGQLRQIAWHNVLLRDEQNRIVGTLSAGEDVTEQRQAEVALRASEAEHRALVQAMPDVVMRFDRDGRHLFVSDNAEAVSGIPSQQFLGRTHRELGFPRRLCDFWEDVIRRVFDGGTPHETEFSFEGPRGPMVFNWRLVPERDAAGNVRSVLSISRDITAHRQAERDYQTIFREMLDGFALHEILCDSEGRPVDYRFLAVNPAFERMTGLTAAAVVGRTVREVLPQTEAHWIETYGRVALTGEPAFFENFHAGLGKHFLVTAFRPAPRQFACIFADITDRKRAETALLESQTELQAIYDHAPVMMCVLSADREVQYVNRALAEFVGKPQTELVHGRVCGILGCIRALDDPRGCGFGPNCTHCALRLAMLDTVQTGKSHTGIEYETTLVLGGQTRTVTLLGSTARIRSAGQDMLLLCLADITDRKRSEEEKRRLEAEVLHAQKLESLGLLAGGIAHDFNNLLSAVVANVDLAKQRLPAASPALPHVEQSLRAASRAADLTRQMLTYAGKGHLLIRRVDLNEVVAENFNLLHACIAKDAELRLDLGDGLPAVAADPGQLQQVVMNLITNAAEALGERPGVVSLHTGFARCDDAALAASRIEEKPPAGEFVFLEVADTGCGMDAETQQRLFDPFFSTKFTGRGLGMSAVLGIVRGHRGAIFVDSAVGSGTTVRVLFPAAASGAAADGEPLPAPPRSEAPPPTFAGTVLMADDDEMARAACQAVLAAFGFQVLVAADGEEAVRVFQEHAGEIACVVLDLTMPKMDGLAAFQAMRQIRPDVKVVLISGYDETEATRQFGGGGLAGFVQKPYRVQALAEEIRRVLYSSRSA
jgi:PAS domain S-box-containing protein